MTLLRMTENLRSALKLTRASLVGPLHVAPRDTREWYGNRIRTYDGPRVVLVNRATRLVLASSHTDRERLIVDLQKRMRRLLEQLGVHWTDTQREVDALATIRYAKTAEAHFLRSINSVWVEANRESAMNRLITDAHLDDFENCMLLHPHVQMEALFAADAVRAPSSRARLRLVN